MKYVKKPIVVEAYQLTEDTYYKPAVWPHWMQSAWAKLPNVPGAIFRGGLDTLGITTLEEHQVISMDDWIIQGVQGEIYPCKPDIFEETYLGVDDE